MDKHGRLAKTKIIITGGPTREWFDPVRFISNPSSGKMGMELTLAAQDYSDDVVFIHGPMHKADIRSGSYMAESVETTEEMHQAVLRYLSGNSILIMSAAPADYKPVLTFDKKIKKTNGKIVLECEPTVDILLSVNQYRSEKKIDSLFVVGFAAETNDLEHYAKDKMNRKGLNMICANDVSKPDAGFGSDTNSVTVYCSDGYSEELHTATKKKIAHSILRIIESQFEKRQ